MFDRPGVCYESAQTRKFKRGRTEVIRSASVQSGEWARAMLDRNVDVRPPSPPFLNLKMMGVLTYAHGRM
jgi:hypothetical protein